MDFILYSLGAVAAALAFFGGALAIWRLIPRPPPQQGLLEAHSRIDELHTVFQGFADQYELSFVRNQAKLGKLRRQLARERGEETEEEEQHAPEHQEPPQPVDIKTHLRQVARERFGR